jgi:hypothetical protein
MRKGFVTSFSFLFLRLSFLLDVRHLRRWADVTVSNSGHNLVWYFVEGHDTPENILLCATAWHAINDACFLVLPHREATRLEDGTHSNRTVGSHPSQNDSHGQTVIHGRY